MNPADWKDLLKETFVKTEPAEEPSSPSDAQNNLTANAPKQHLILRFEKRHGKPTTIVSRFVGTEQALKALAAGLKKHCSAGGSAKDDEILIQGDVRKKVAEYLRLQGHSVRGDIER